eukprot:6289817-Prymnesium_polylepis.1
MAHPNPQYPRQPAGPFGPRRHTHGGSDRQARRLREVVRADAKRGRVHHRQRRQAKRTTGLLNYVPLGARRPASHRRRHNLSEAVVTECTLEIVEGERPGLAFERSYT